MQASVLNFFMQLSQKALDKSRAFYCPLSVSAEEEVSALSDTAFAAMLREIDAFSAQLRARSTPSGGDKYNRN